jgi:hypothetical protein
MANTPCKTCGDTAYKWRSSLGNCSECVNKCLKSQVYDAFGNRIMDKSSVFVPIPPEANYQYDSCHWPPREKIDHPAHYGGKDDPYEAIKVIDAWGLGFCLGNTLKYIRRAGRKLTRIEIDVSTHDNKGNKFISLPNGQAEQIEDLKKALWYLNHEIERLSSITATSNTSNIGEATKE